MFQALIDWNPWWNDLQVPKDLSGLLRPKYDIIKESLATREALVLTGIRRSGKSTLLYQLIEYLLIQDTSPHNILFVNFEDPNFDHYSLDDLFNTYSVEFNPKGTVYFFLDEIHHKPSWPRFIRSHHDRKNAIKFVLTSSNAGLIQEEYATVLTGRILSFEIFPFSFDEFLRVHNTTLNHTQFFEKRVNSETVNVLNHHLLAYLKRGGFPATLELPDHLQKRLLVQYYNDILSRDIVSRFEASSRITKDLANYFITNFTSEYSLRSLRGTYGFAYDTIKQYIHYFEEVFIFFKLNHFSYSVKTQQTYPTKIYCIDNGLRNAVAFKFSQDLGRLAENTVFLHLRQLGADVFYWKDHRNEVDFVIMHKDGSLTGINVSYSDNPPSREIEGLVAFQEKYKQVKSLQLVVQDTTVKIPTDTRSNVSIIPLWSWLLNYSLDHELMD